MTKAKIAATSSVRRLFNQLRATRNSHETLYAARICDGADHLERLHNLRAEGAVTMQGLGL